MKKTVIFLLVICLITVFSNFNASAAASTAAKAGKKLYNTNCKGCHGTKGAGGFGPNIVGMTVSNIKQALKTVSAMQSIKISVTDIKKIAAYLKAPF